MVQIYRDYELKLVLSFVEVSELATGLGPQQIMNSG